MPLTRPGHIPHRLTAALALTATLLAVTACATVEGAGRDISKAGEMVSEGAREVRRAF